MKLRPLFDRVLIQREQLKTTGIIVPDSAKKRNAPHRGIVTAIGPSCEHDPPIKVGDRVMFGMHSGAEIDADGIETYIVAGKDLLLVIE